MKVVKELAGVLTGATLVNEGKHTIVRGILTHDMRNRFNPNTPITTSPVRAIGNINGKVAVETEYSIYIIDGALGV